MLQGLKISFGPLRERGGFEPIAEAIYILKMNSKADTFFAFRAYKISISGENRDYWQRVELRDSLNVVPPFA